ncbi:hypothetical protein M758_6G183600 [Ceratodon purpureus]|nr:hypothetical protein M758_6G183600 [Ceratodon purpureus]
MSINDISTCLKGGRSCGVGREEDASNLLWCEHCAIALCFECDTNLHNSKNSKHGHLRVLLPASRTEEVRKCEHGGDGSSTVRLGLISKPSPPKNKRRASKKDSGRRSSSSRNGLSDGGSKVTPHDVGEATIKSLGTSDVASIEPVPNCEKAPASAVKLPRSALRGGYEEAGLGSRPKLNVTWHPDVKEPICSIASHTVGHKRGPAFLSRRSQQKQLRQKSKASSKSQKHAKKQESNKIKKGEPVKARSDGMCNPNENLVLDLESSNISGAPTEEETINPMWSNCTYCIQEERLCDCVNMSDGSIGDPYLQSVLLESIVRPENLTEKTVQDSNIVKMEDKKSSAFATDERLNETLPEDYRQLFASMFQAASSIGQGVELHAPGANLSGSKQVFKPATQGKFSPLISVV